MIPTFEVLAYSMRWVEWHVVGRYWDKAEADAQARRYGLAFVRHAVAA